MHSIEGTSSNGGLHIGPSGDPRAVKILARTLFREMVANGLTHDQVLALATQLIVHVTEELKEARPNGRA